jgi:hypothetical protein
MYTILDETTLYREADGTSIPMDPQNTDYVAYLAWVAKQSPPEFGEDPESAIPKQPAAEDPAEVN